MRKVLEEYEQAKFKDPTVVDKFLAGVNGAQDYVAMRLMRGHPQPDVGVNLK